MTQNGQRWMTAMRVAVWIVTLGGVAALWSFAELDVPHPGVFAVVLGVAMLGGGCIIVTGLLGLTQGRKAIAAANLLIGFGTWCAIGGFVYQVLSNEEADITVVGHADKPAKRVTRIRLFDLNVDHGYPDFEEHEQRFQETLAELKRLDADVLVLQEAWNTNQHGNMAERLGKELGFNYVYARANGSRPRIGFEEGAAILSRFPILEAKRLLMKPRTPWWENRIALVATLDLGDETLTLAGVHLSNSPSANDQAEYLADIVKEHRPDIIAGDLNAEPDSRAVLAFRKPRFGEIVPETAMRGDHLIRLPDEKVPGPFIDHVFLGEAFETRWRTKEAMWIVTSKPVGSRGAISDHDGILIDFVRR